MGVIKIGPAGCGGLDSLHAVERAALLGFQAMEIEFVQGVKMSNQLASQVGAAAEQGGIDLSVHAPYWINLSSDDLFKRTASLKYIMDSAERAHYLGAKVVVFHAAFYGNRSHEEVSSIVRGSVDGLQEVIKKNGWNVRLAPEVTGKTFQWGTLDEVIQLHNDINSSFCVDVAHLYARNGGVVKYEAMVNSLKEAHIEHIHFHFSGIEFYAKGERKHLPLGNGPSFLNFVRELVTRSIDATVICECPDPWLDAMQMVKELEVVRSIWSK